MIFSFILCAKIKSSKLFFKKTVSTPTLPTAPVTTAKKESAFRSILNKGTKRFSSHFAELPPSSPESKIVPGSINGGSFDSTASTTTSSKAWIKDKVTGSLNKLATSRAAYSSVDTVHHASADLVISPSVNSDSSSPVSTSALISKSQSESNLKTASSLTNV